MIDFVDEVIPGKSARGYKDLKEDDRIQICHNLLLDNVYADDDKKYKVFYKQGGINKPMIEVKKEDVNVN